MAAYPTGSNDTLESPTAEVLLDVAPLLQRAAAAMKPGQLLHGDTFSLFESVTAVEIGNVRMDAGADREVRSAEQLVAAGGAPTTLDSGRVLAVMDRLLCLEAAWHLGHFLPQSVYTCLHMLLPDRAEGILPLAAYCKALRGSCNTARSLTLVSNVCMDEDIMPHAFGLDVEDRSCMVAGSLKPLAALTLAEDRLNSGKGRPQSSGGISSHAGQQALSDSSSGPVHGLESGKDKCSESQPALSSASQSVGHSAAEATATAAAAAGEAPRVDPRSAAEEPFIRDALLARLRFRRALHQVLEKLLAFSAPADLAGAAAYIRAAQGHLADIKSSTATAAAADDPVVEKCFDAVVNRPLMSPTPPRRMPIPTLEETLQHFESMLANLLAVCHISTVSTWRHLQAFLHQYQDRNPGHIERAALHLVLRGGKAAGSGTPPPSAPPWTPRPAMTAAVVGLPTGAGVEQPCEEATVFLEQATIVTQNWCQAMCLNSSRVRRRLRRLFEDWGHLYGHACVADAAPQVAALLQAAGWESRPDLAGPIATWVEGETASMLMHSVTAGCSQELYTPREYPALYWYCNYLVTVMLEAQLALSESAPHPDRLPSHPDAASAGVTAGAAKSNKSAKAAAGGKTSGSSKRNGKSRKGKGTRGPGQPPHGNGHAPAATQLPAANKGGKKATAAQLEGLRSDADLRQALLTLGDVERHMCQGTFRAAAGARLSGHLEEPRGAPPDAEALRFQQRFAAFEVIMRPDPLTYHQYTEMMHPAGVQPQQLFLLAVQSLQKAYDLARHALAGRFSTLFSSHETKMLHGIEKTAAQNVTALRVIASTVIKGSAGGLRLTWGFKHHPHFPTLSLKR